MYEDIDGRIPISNFNFSNQIMASIKGSKSLHIMLIRNKTKEQQNQIAKLRPHTLDNDHFLATHLQNIEDSAIIRDNLLIEEMNEIDCNTKQNRRNTILSTATINGILAAKELGLPACHTIQASFSTIAVTKCEEMKVNVTAHKSKCGFQPKTNNHSIALDGWRIVPYSSCLWTTRFVNLNDKLYRVENDTWTIVKPSMRLAHHSMVALFNITQDESINWITQKREHIDYAAMDHPNIVADIASILQENNLQRVSDVATFPSDITGFTGNKIWSWGPFNTISTWFWSIVYIIGAAIAIAILYKCFQCCRMCRKCCNCLIPNPSVV